MEHFRLILFFVFVLTAHDALAYSVPPDCHGLTSALTYTLSTNAFGCNSGLAPVASPTFTGVVTAPYYNASTASSGYELNGVNGLSYPSSDSGGGTIAIGSGALSGQTTSHAYSNTAVGYEVMGYQAMSTAAVNNAAFGYQAMYKITQGSSNTALGYEVLSSLTTGSNNTAIGQYSGSALTTGSSNLLFGPVANNLSTGSYNILVGSSGSCNTVVTNDSNEIVFCGPNGASWYITGSNTPSTQQVVMSGQLSVGATVKTGGYLVSTLPSGTVGMRAYVTNQTTSCPSPGGALTGGGSVTCPVFYNGSAWVGD